jgi:MATE family multidrug resistance protein
MIKKFFVNSHTRETLILAWPLIITQVGHIITGMVDNMFLGRIGAAEQAAGILSNNIYILIMVFAIGMSYATTPLVTAAHESSNLLKKASLLKNSLFLNGIVACLCFLVLFLSSDFLHYMRQPAEVVVLAKPFFEVLIFSMIPISFFFVGKQYCEGLSNTRMALLISVTGNLLNVILNYVLIYGAFGFPEMGYLGAAWASFIARLYMGVSFMFLIFKSTLTKEVATVFSQVKINAEELLDLWRLGWNSALQFTFEVGAFVIAGLMAGSFGKENIDAHGIAMSIAACTYMFATGISSAGTIRVGIFKAQNNWEQIKNASSYAIKLVMLMMGSFGILFWIGHNYLPLAFTKEIEIVELTAQLLIVAAFFQLFDGMQVTLLGLLRGLQDVKIPTLITLIGYWVIALPLAYFLAFNLNLKTVGIWIALLLALAFVSGTLLWRLWHLIKKNM